MKKYIYIFCIALLAAACVDPLQPYTGPIANEPEDDAKVTLEFSLPPMTKGLMADDPTISTIHVAVFTSAGMLKQFEQATLTHPAGEVLVGKNAKNPTYSVEVNMSSSKRILHFIADSPITSYNELVAAAGTSGEDVILNALITSHGETSYWQRIELDKIDAYVYDGVEYDGRDYDDGVLLQGNPAEYVVNDETIPVYKGDFIKRNGRKVLDGTGYFQSETVAAKIANIPLVRNFAKITVSSTSSTNFIPQKFALVNVPKGGYVAPFDSKKGEFCSAYIEVEANTGVESLTHSYVAATDYLGTLVGSIDPSKPSSFIDLTATSQNAVKTAYMYERTMPTKSQPATCILVAGKYDNDGDGNYEDEDGALRDSDKNTWFKIEIADTKGAYFPIYRGLSYNIQIGAISGTNGYASADDAYNAEPIGDVSGSITTATLEQINDGKGTTLWVEYVDYVTSDQEDKTLFYTMFYQPTSGGEIAYLTEDVKLTVNHPDASYKAINKDEDAQISGTEYSGTGTPDDTKTWYKATVPLNASGQNTLLSKLHVEGNTPAATGSKKMYREVSYRVMGTQQFQNGNNVLKATPLPSEDKDEITTLTIYLPSDLGFSMFPLVLQIEAQNGNFTTMDGLPVESGKSLFDESKNSFYFLKTIEYDDYNALVSAGSVPAFTAKFKTTRDGTTSANHTNATKFRVLDKIKTGRTTTYFEVAECDVTVGGPVFKLYYNGEETNSASVNADVTRVSFDIRSTGDENPTWTLTPSDNIISISATPALLTTNTGSGNATVTVTIPANGSDTETKTYTVIATREGFDAQTFTITQNAKVTLEPVTRTISVTSSTFNNSYVYTGDYNSEVAISLINGQQLWTNCIDVNYNGGGITLSANTITSIVITWFGTTYASSSTTINSGGGSISYSQGNNPTTTWTGSSDSVSLSFGRTNTSSYEFSITQIVVTYLHETE